MLRLWDTPDVWPHRFEAASVFGFAFAITVARDEDRVTMAIWREDRRMCQAWMSTDVADRVGRALRLEAAQQP